MTTTPVAVPTTFAEAAVRLAHAVEHVFEEVGRDHGLTPQQAQLLCVLAVGPTGMTELSHVLHIERSSLSGLIDRIERRGLVARSRDDTDRRACRASLTADGDRLAHAVHAAVVARVEQRTTGVDDADRAALVRVVAAIVSG